MKEKIQPSVRAAFAPLLTSILLSLFSCSKSGSDGIASAATSDKPAEAKTLKIGFVYTGPIGDVGWTKQHDVGRKFIEQEFGSKIETTFVENVPESGDAERVIRQLATDGAEMVFTTSFGFMEPTIKLAKEFPEVTFEHATGYKFGNNVGVYQSRFYEGAYLLGILAGKMTKSNILGFVGSYPIPEVLRNINGFTRGARSVNDKVLVKVVWVNTWYDPPKEHDAAVALAGQGADVLYQNTDSAAVVQLAEEKGIHAFGQDSDMSKYGPKAHLSANVVNWGVYYKEKVKEKLDGKWKPEDTKWGMKEGMIELSPLNAAVPPDVAQVFEQTKAAIREGKFHPFAGPVKLQDGSVKVPEGQVISDEDLWGMKFYVEGVEGKIPS
jgi:simple sugar transport system substrate-binding protein